MNISCPPCVIVGLDLRAQRSRCEALRSITDKGDIRRSRGRGDLLGSWTRRWLIDDSLSASDCDHPVQLSQVVSLIDLVISVIINTSVHTMTDNSLTIGKHNRSPIIAFRRPLPGPGWRRLATHRSQWKGFLSRHECIPGMWPYIRVTIPEFSRVLFIVTISPRDAASFRNNRTVRGTKTEIFATITGTMREKGPSFYVNNRSQKEKYSARRVATRSHWSLLTVLMTRCRHPLPGPRVTSTLPRSLWSQTARALARERLHPVVVMRIMTNLLREQWPGSRGAPLREVTGVMMIYEASLTPKRTLRPNKSEAILQQQQ